MEITTTDYLANSEFNENEKSPPEPWHQLVRDKISRQSYRYSSPQTSSRIEEFREKLEEKLVANTVKLTDRHPKTFITQVLEDDLLAMAGIAILAAYLRTKKGLRNLFVCKSLEAFRKKLDEISRLKENIRLALVLTNSPETKEDHDKKDGEYGTDIRHKLAICIEKTGDQIKIAILDPMGIADHQISPVKVLSPASDLKYAELEGIDYLLWYIYHSTLNMKETSVYYSKVRRQKSSTGCETFALSDGIEFLRDPHFFDSLQTKRLLFTEGKAQLRLHKISSLPPAFMRGTQSLKLLKKYYKKNKKLGAIETLKEEVKKHLIKVDGKLQNHTIAQKSIKYHLITAAALKHIPTEKLQRIIDATLLRAPRLSLNEDQPQTLSDLHLFRHEVMIENDP